MADSELCSLLQTVCSCGTWNPGNPRTTTWSLPFSQWRCS